MTTERGDTVAALWRNKHVGHVQLLPPGDIRLLCEPASSEGTASSRAAGLKTSLLRTQVVLAGKWPNHPGVFAARIWRPRRQPQPALLAANSPMGKGNLVELLLLNAEDGKIEAVSVGTASKTLKHTETSSTIALAPEGNAPTAEDAAVADKSKDKQEHIIVVEILKFVRYWQEGVHRDPTKLRELVEAIADQAKKTVPNLLKTMDDALNSSTSQTMMLVNERETPKSARGKQGGPLTLGSLTVPLRRGSKGHVPLPGQGSHISPTSTGKGRVKGSGKGAEGQEEERWIRKTVRSEHVVCLELPKPLDRLFLLLSKKDRPQGNKLESIRRALDPSDAFADLLLGESRHSLREYYKPETATLVTTQPIVSRNFAAMTSLFGAECEVAKLGPLQRPKEDLKMLCLWSMLQSLTYSDADVKDLSLLSRLEALKTLELHDMGPGLTDISNCNPPGLQHLRLKKCPGLTSGQNLPQVRGLLTLVLEHCDAMKTLNGMRAIPSNQMAVTHCPKLESIEGLAMDGVQLPPMMDFGWNPVLQVGVHTIASVAGVQHIDLQGCPKLDVKVLLQAARALKSSTNHAGLICPSLFPLLALGNAEGGNPLSPRMAGSPRTARHPWGKNSRRSGNEHSPVKAGTNPWTDVNNDGSASENPSRAKNRALTKQASDLLELMDLAAESAEVKVQSARMLVQKIVSDLDDSDRIYKSLTVLGEVLRHMKEINGTPVTADEMKVDMLSLRMTGQFGRQLESRNQSRNTSRFESLRSDIEFITIETGSVLLHDIGWNREDAKNLLQYADVDQQGFVTETDLALLFEHGSPASTEDMTIFHVWILETFEGGITECYDSLVEDSPWVRGDLLSRSHFEHAVMNNGYGKSNAKAIFTCLDADRRSGFVTANEFALIRFFVAFHALKVAEGFKKQLCKKYKSLDGAFKALSTENGTIPMSELQELGKKWKVVSRQASSDEAYHFLTLHPPTHKDGTVNYEEVSREGLMALEGMSATTFRNELRKLWNHIMLTYSNFDAAFAAFNPRKAGLTREEFVDGFKSLLHLDTVCDLDPDVLYQFLDLYNTGMLSKKVFSLLGGLSVEAMWDDIAENREKLLRRFRGNAAEAFGRLKAILQEKKLKEVEKLKVEIPAVPVGGDPASPGRKKSTDAMRPSPVVPMRSFTAKGEGAPSPKTPGTSRQRITSGSNSLASESIKE